MLRALSNEGLAVSARLLQECQNPAMGIYGTGSIFQRGKIWYVSYFDGVNTRMRSTKSTKRAEAVKLRDKILKMDALWNELALALVKDYPH
jgi:hypothetical protein